MLRSPLRAVLGSLLLMLVGLAFAADQQVQKDITGAPIAPITLTNPKNLPWPTNIAQKVYFEACAATALELNPGHPPTLAPPVSVELGADQNSVDFNEGRVPQTRIKLKKWDEELFALAVVIAARDSSIDQHKAQVLAHQVTVIVESMKTVQQEKEDK